MPAKIVMKKFGAVVTPSYSDNLDKQDFQKSKTLFFEKRFIKKFTGSKRDPDTFYRSSDNFKRNWFCKNCYRILNLKRARKYKTLLEYDLICPHCKSANITHRQQLSKAVRNSISPSEISKISKQDNIEIEFTITDKKKYYPVMFSNTQKKIANKEYFFLQENSTDQR